MEIYKYCVLSSEALRRRSRGKVNGRHKSNEKVRGGGGGGEGGKEKKERSMVKILKRFLVRLNSTPFLNCTTMLAFHLRAKKALNILNIYCFKWSVYGGK